jgi:catechol 2,3-dioxygenase-like lactoylglutathione lyase family enzyme
MRLAYVITFVADMDAAVAFYRDTLGFKLRFQSPGWSEFDTGSTTLALQRARPRIRPAAHGSACPCPICRRSPRA